MQINDEAAVNKEEKVVEPAEFLTPEDQKNMPAYETMLRAGVVYGRKKSKLNPKMQPFVYTFRSGVALFDLTKVLEQLTKATTFLTSTIASGSKILVVATQPAAKAVAKKFAEDYKLFFITERWLAGILTNFKTISARIEYFKKLKSDRVTGRYEKYTKKERLLIDREIDNLNLFFNGIEDMTALPKVILIIDPVLHETAAREARRLKIPVIAFMNSDSDPSAVQYAVPGNASAGQSIKWFFGALDAACTSAKQSAVAPTITPVVVSEAQ